MRKRDWKRINEALVRRGELLLDLDFVKGLKAPDHSSIQWRAEMLPIKLDNVLAKVE